MTDNQNNKKDVSHIRKAWDIVGIVVLVAVLLLIFEATFSVILLIFAGTLVAVFFRGLSGLIQRKTKWNEKVCVTLSIICTLALAVGFFWLVGAKIQAQATELSETLPKTIEQAKNQLEDSSIGDGVVEKLTSKKSMEKLQTFAGSFFKSTFGVLGDLYVVLFIGIFLTVAPKTYVSGAIELVPEKNQDRAKRIFDALGEQLRNWIKGQLLSMFVVFILTAIGLAIMGIPLWLVLSLLAGLLSFIPNFGPLISLIPAVLVGLMQGPETALWIAALYILIQFVESNFITTLIQQKMVDMPPALIISAQMILGALTGSWGLVLSTPLTVVLILLTKQLYIEPRRNKSMKEKEANES